MSVINVFVVDRPSSDALGGPFKTKKMAEEAEKILVQLDSDLSDATRQALMAQLDELRLNHHGRNFVLWYQDSKHEEVDQRFQEDPGAHVTQAAPQTPATPMQVIGILLTKVATGELGMQDAQKELRTWFKSQTVDDQAEIAKLNEKVQTLKMMAEGIAQEFFVVSLPYRR